MGDRLGNLVPWPTIVYIQITFSGLLRNVRDECLTAASAADIDLDSPRWSTIGLIHISDRHDVSLWSIERPCDSARESLAENSRVEMMNNLASERRM
jgi:hypothetical protein